MRTFRRTYLDDALTQNLGLFTGRVLDVGGKKVRKRGLFDPGGAPATSWEYLNVDPATEPDILASAEEIPVDDDQFDSVMLSEVLQHLERPDMVLQEIQRILKPGGRVVATIPFLFPVHRDPEDYQRWPPARLEIELKRAGMETEVISPMGSAAAVLFDLCWVTWGVYVTERLPVVLQRLAAAPFLLVKPLVALLDKRLDRVRERINTGYLVVARKPA